MNGSIHRERTASEPQDRSSSAAPSIEVPSETIQKWQEFVNLLAEIMHVPSASIMRADPPHIKVFVSSTSEGNPCEPGALDTGPYCKTVMKGGQPLLVPNALENEAWKANPHVRLGMISYLGVPISWPNGRLFGTICVRDNKSNEYSEAYLKLLLHFRDMLQADLKSLVGLHGEIEEREAKIRRSEAYLTEAQTLSKTGSWAINPAMTKILYWSEEAYRIWGFDPLQGLPNRQTVWLRIHPDDRERVLKEAEHALREKRDYSSEFRIVVPAGTVKYLEAIGHHQFSADGELVQVVGTNIDVTERKRAEEALRRDEAWLAQAQRLSHTGTWVMNATTRRFQYWSDESYRIWGFDPLQGLPSREDMWGRIHPDDRERVWGEVQEALREERDLFAEFRILLPDETVKYLEANTHHEFSPHGALLEVVCTNVDVTERKRAQEERERLRQLESDLAHMNRLSMMGELAASLAHEITQPIAAARNNARAAQNFLDMQPPDLGEVREALGCVVGDADRAGLIVDRIRDHIKKAPPRKHRFDLNEAINEVIVLARSAIAENGVSVQTRLTEGLAPVEGDRVQLQQVFLNLILNAAEAMGAVDEGV